MHHISRRLWPSLKIQTEGGLGMLSGLPRRALALAATVVGDTHATGIARSLERAI